MHDLEALSGLPVDVKFISFEDVKNGLMKDEPGAAGMWKDDDLLLHLQSGYTREAALSV